MRNFSYLLLISLANNIDNIGVRIVYSLKGIKITAPINIWISVITFAITYSAAYSGAIFSGYISDRLRSFIAMVLLTAIGFWMILTELLKLTNGSNDQFAHKNKLGIFQILRKPDTADRDNSKCLDIKEATLLGIALSINNVGGGISAGIIGLNTFWVGVLSAVLSFLALWAGNHLAELCIKWNLANKTTIIAGVLLIAVGIEQIL